MILEAFGVSTLSEKIQKVKDHDDSPNTSDMTQGERITLIIEIILVLILYIVILGLWIWSIMFAFQKQDVIWGVFIIIGGLPVSLIYLLFISMINK